MPVSAITKFINTRQCVVNNTMYWVVQNFCKLYEFYFNCKKNLIRKNMYHVHALNFLIVPICKNKLNYKFPGIWYYVGVKPHIILVGVSLAYSLYFHS